MKKFTMELVWHNCYEYPPSENHNDNLYITNGHWVHRADYSTENGWYDFRTGDYLPFEMLWEYWWADMEQTIQGEHRFNIQKDFKRYKDMLFKSIRKVLDDFENTNNKLDNDEELTREDEDAIWYSDLRLAEALMKDWCGAERVAMIILAEKGIPERFEVKFDNEIAFNDK